MNNALFLTLLRFVLLVLTQVLIFNSLNFMGGINPMVYVIFFYWYPLKGNQSIFMLVSFFLGLLIDMFSDTLALGAIASLTVAYAPSGDPEVLFRGELRVPELQFQKYHQAAAPDLFGPVGIDPSPGILFPGNFGMVPLPLNFEKGICHRFGNFGALYAVQFTF